MKALYTASATTVGGRNGHVESSDGVLKADLAIPKEMGGPGGAKTNPEQLFAAGYSACFGSALEFVARQKKIHLQSVQVHAEVSIGPKEGGGFLLAAALHITLPGIAKDQAEALIAEAHQVCPYSNATRGNIEVTLSLEAVG